MSRRNFTAAERRRAMQLLRDGVPQFMVATVIGCNVLTLRRWCLQQGRCPRCGRPR